MLKHPSDAGLVPVVLAIMHVAYGVGTMRGAVRHDPPLAAVAGTLGFTGLAVTPDNGAPGGVRPVPAVAARPRSACTRIIESRVKAAAIRARV